MILGVRASMLVVLVLSQRMRCLPLISRGTRIMEGGMSSRLRLQRRHREVTTLMEGVMISRHQRVADGNGVRVVVIRVGNSGV
jgi:hypothetical protein